MKVPYPGKSPKTIVSASESCPQLFTEQTTTIIGAERASESAADFKMLQPTSSWIVHPGSPSRRQSLNSTAVAETPHLAAYVLLITDRSQILRPYNRRYLRKCLYHRDRSHDIYPACFHICDTRKRFISRRAKPHPNRGPMRGYELGEYDERCQPSFIRNRICRPHEQPLLLPRDNTG